MEFENPKIKKLYKYLSSMSCKAYSDPRLISNDILCKQDSHGLILETYLSGKIPKKMTFSSAVKKILLYFGKNFIAFLLYLVTAIAHRFSKQVFFFPEKNQLRVLHSWMRLDDSGALVSLTSIPRMYFQLKFWSRRVFG